MTLPQKAIVSYLHGTFWLRAQEKIRIPAEHCTSQAKLEQWVESQIGDNEVLYNFDTNLLPAEEKMVAPELPPPSRVVKLPNPALFARAPAVMMAEQMAMRKAQGISTEGIAVAPRVTLTCAWRECGKSFERLASHHQYRQAQIPPALRTGIHYCSRSCQSAATTKPNTMVTLVCAHCWRSFDRSSRGINKGAKMAFCCTEHRYQYFREHPAGGKS